MNYLWDDKWRSTELCLHQRHFCFYSLLCFITRLDFDMLLFRSKGWHSNIWECETILEFSFVNVGLDIIDIKTHVNLTLLDLLLLIRSKSWPIGLQCIAFFKWLINPLLFYRLHWSVFQIKYFIFIPNLRESYKQINLYILLFVINYKMPFKYKFQYFNKNMKWKNYNHVQNS